MKKRLLALTLSFAMLLTLLAACGDSSSKDSDQPSGTNSSAPADDGKTYTMRIGTLTVETEQNTATALDFKTRIEEATGGRVVVEVYGSAQLGTAAQMVEGMQTGTIQGGLFPTDYLASAYPAAACVGVPGFVGTDIDSLCAVMNELGGVDILNEGLTQVGLHMVGCLYTDKYSYLLADRKVTALADAADMKIWAPPSDYTDAIIRGMGGSSTFFDTSDLAVSVQQGTVNGALASPALYSAQKLYETCKYCMGMVGRAGCTAFIMSESFLQELPEDLRATVLEVAMTSIMEFEYPYAAAAAENSLKVMEEGGCEIYMSSDIPALQAELDQLYADNVQLYLDNTGDAGQAMYESFQALLAQYNAG